MKKSKLRQIIKEEIQKIVEVNSDIGISEKKAWDRLQKILKSFSDEARELQLYVENDGDLYRQQMVPIQKNLKRKADKGTFDIKLAPKLFMYLVDAGAKKYMKDHGSPGDRLQDIFPKKERQKVAEYFAYEWAVDYLSSEFD